MFSGYQDYQAQRYADALPQLKRLAEMGHAEAQSMVGSIYHLGFGQIEIDEEAAIDWYERASAQGHGLASNNLACIRIIQGDTVAATRLYQLARDQGFPHVPADA